MKKWIGILLFYFSAFLLFFAMTTIQKEPHISKALEIDPKQDHYKIVIDPGHGGVDPGAMGASGSHEKDFTLSLVKKVANLLEKTPHFEVYLTRQEDVFLSAESRERPKYANGLDADVYVSIHANTFSDPTVSGTETYFYDKSSKSLANTLHKHITNATGFKDRGVRKEEYFVLKDTTMPAALLEIGYLTNPEEEQKMLTDEFQQSVAEAIQNGIKEYLFK